MILLEGNPDEWTNADVLAWIVANWVAGTPVPGWLVPYDVMDPSRPVWASEEAWAEVEASAERKVEIIAHYGGLR